MALTKITGTGLETLSDGVTITTADNTSQLVLKSTDADATEGPRLDFHRDSSSPADGDVAGVIRFLGDDDGGNTVNMAELEITLDDITAGSDDATIKFHVMNAGTRRNNLKIGGTEVVINEDSVDLDFRVETNAQTNAFFVDSGNELISMTVPVTITTSDNSNNLTLTSTDADANTGPNLVMTRASGSPADNDAIGELTFNFNNDAAENTVGTRWRNFIIDASDSTEDAAFDIFSIKAGALTSIINYDASTLSFNDGSADIDFRVESNDNANMLFVDAGNNLVGVGTGSPAARLNVHDEGSSSNSILLQLHSDSTSFSSNVMEIITERSTTNSTFNVLKYRTTGSASTRFFIRDSGNVENTNNSYGAVSDESLKKNITDAASQWDDIKALTVRKFHFNEQADDDPKLLGLVAQEVEKISAGLVSTAYDEEEEKDIKSVKYSVLYMKAVKALQEAMTRIETLEAKVTALENA